MIHDPSESSAGTAVRIAGRGSVRGRPAAGTALGFFPAVYMSVQEQVFLFCDVHASLFHIIRCRILCLYGIQLVFPSVHPEKGNDKTDSQGNKCCQKRIERFLWQIVSIIRSEVTAWVINASHRSAKPWNASFQSPSDMASPICPVR